MRQLTTLELKNRKYPVTDSKSVVWLKNILYPVLMALTRIKVKYKIEAVNDYYPINEKAIIFACNHSAFTDTPIALGSVRHRSYIFAGLQNLFMIDWLFFSLNGVIWVDRKNKDDMLASKDALLSYLNQGQSILWFPEGTWNLTPNLLMLPMRWGIIEVARQANAQIIPMALDYDRNKNLCRVKFGAPLTGDDLENNRNGICTLRNAMATLRWEMMEDRPTLSRAETNLEELKKEAETVITEYSALNWEYECSCIYEQPSYISPDKAFEHLRHLIPCKENAFLLRKKTPFI